MPGIFSAQPYLDGVAGEFNFLLDEAERLAGGDAQLQFDQVEPGVASVTGCSTCRRVFISMK